MLQKITLGVVMMCLCLAMVGCQGAAIQVHAAQAVTQESPMSSESIEIYNCDAPSDLHRSLAEEAQVVSTTTISDFATSTNTGDSLELSEELKASLAAQIELNYQTNFEEAKAEVALVDLLVPFGKIRTYIISWKQEVYSSTVAFKFNNTPYTVEYTYILDIPAAAISTEFACTG